MRQRGIPRPVIDFIGEHLSSVAQLEILLLLHGEQGRPRTADEVAEQLRIEPQWAGAEMEKLRAGGIVTSESGAYCYGPGSDEVRAVVDDLAKAYRTHRVSVITAIFSTPSDSVGSFADAFKIRRSDDG